MPFLCWWYLGNFRDREDKLIDCFTRWQWFDDSCGIKGGHAMYHDEKWWYRIWAFWTFVWWCPTRWKVNFSSNVEIDNCVVRLSMHGDDGAAPMPMISWAKRFQEYFTVWENPKQILGKRGGKISGVGTRKTLFFTINEWQLGNKRGNSRANRRLCRGQKI